MKNFLRLCALLCTLTLLLGAAAGCVSTLPKSDETLPAPSESESASATTPDTAPVVGTPVIGPETLPQTEEESEPPSADTEPESETQPVEDIFLPAGHKYLFEGEGLKGVSMQEMVATEETDADGTHYMVYRGTESDPRVYFATTPGDNRLSGIRYMRIKYRTAKVTTAQIFIGNERESNDGRADLDLIADGEWHILTVDLMTIDTYAENLSIFRFDPMKNRKSGTVDVVGVAFYPDDGAPNPNSNPLEKLPEIPEDAPNLTEYQKFPEGSIYYKADGGNNGTYTFKDGFKMDMYSHEYFNRYTLGYDSTSPLRGEITYTLMLKNGEGETHTEAFFLEAGQNMSFSSLIDGYFNDAYAYNIREINLKSADGSTAEFTIRSVSTNVVDVLKAGTYYMENDRYIVGVMLKWGGTISYIEDKQDGDPEIGNLINRFDPGRLVQQSYYGVGNGPHYTAGYYNGTQWNYNPVQGGNLKGTPSKLVDFRISEDGMTVYIKCRPQDWAQANSLTPSYMENTYTLRENGIHVSNRFVDFFGVKHGARHAELPAFYTISHLGVFHFYNGNKPWTEDAYTSLPNEPDWAGNSKCYHNVAKGNTETWAAWTNTAGYGIGLYVPGTEILLAGRHNHNGSKDPYNAATNYVAPLRTMEFFSFVPFEYEYFISTGTVPEMRKTFLSFAQQ